MLRRVVYNDLLHDMRICTIWYIFKLKLINLYVHQVRWYVAFDNLIFYRSVSFESTTSFRKCRPPHLMNPS